MEKIIRPPATLKEWQTYYDLRYRILREPWGQIRGSERNELDDVSIHAACFINDQLVGVGRLDNNPNGYGQVRFMAVENSFQGKGIGKAIIFYLEKLSVERKDSGMILHAREGALGFYENIGYSVIEKSHLLFGEIQHYLMSKKYV